MAPVRRPRTGDRIGEYVLEEKLGGGGFGEVWKASHAELPGVVAAVKIPTDAAFIENLRDEGLLQADLDSPHVVRVLGLDPCADPPYLTMEYVAGRSLRELLARKKRLPLGEAVRILVQILRGLAAAHARGVVHHDIKPANILLAEDGTVKVADFGLGRVKETTASLLLQSGSHRTAPGGPITGTLRYMAPEQREGRRGDRRSDLYALGVVFFEMITGEFPQGAERPTELRPSLPAWVDEVFQRCYTRLDRRYDSAEAMAADLEKRRRSAGPVVFLGDVKVRPAPEAPRPPSSAPGRPDALVLLPLYALHLAFQGLSRGTRELMRFLSGDHPERSRVAPYFLLFLALFGISLLVSLGLRRRAADPRPAPAALAPGRTADVLSIDTLVECLRDDTWREPARRELLRRGPGTLPRLRAIYQRVRGEDPLLHEELGSVIHEIRDRSRRPPRHGGRR